MPDRRQRSRAKWALGPGRGSSPAEAALNLSAGTSEVRSVSKNKRRRLPPVTVHFPGLVVGVGIAAHDGNIGLAIGLGAVVEVFTVVKILAARADLPELIDRVRRPPPGVGG